MHKSSACISARNSRFGSVLVMAIIVGAVRAFDLAQEINNQFSFTRVLAEVSMERAVEAVNRALDRSRIAITFPKR